MRLGSFVSAALALLFSTSVFAADDPWITYVSAQDRFALNLPGQPKIEEFTYTSEYNSPWKARRYTVDYQGYVYRMSVVDMSTTVLTAAIDQFRNVGRPGNEKRGAMAFALANLRKTGQVTLDTYDQLQVIPGYKLDIILPDGRQNTVALHTHFHLLYILEIFSPKDAVPGYDVQSSLELLDGQGNVPRYVDDGFPGKIPRAPAAVGAAAAGRDLKALVGTGSSFPTGVGGWITYVSRQDRFALNLPGQPKVEEFVYSSPAGSPWKARRYTSEHQGYQYKMTVVDMSTTGLTPDKDQFRNVARPASEKSGAMAHALWNLRKTGKVLVDAYEELQVIPGFKLEVELPDGRMNIAEVHTHYDFLYITECISPKGAVPGYDVQASLELLDADGNVPRYVDNERTFPEFVTMAGDGAAAAGRDVGAQIRGGAAAP